MSDNASVMNVDGASVSEAILSDNETRDIVLPNQNEHVAHIAVDVGAFGQQQTDNLLYAH
jgi:type II pantothenate kinase